MAIWMFNSCCWGVGFDPQCVVADYDFDCDGDQKMTSTSAKGSRKKELEVLQSDCLDIHKSEKM